MCEKFRVKVFCFCCSLQKGSIVIGTLGWIMSLMQLFYFTNPIKDNNDWDYNRDQKIAGEIFYCIVTLIACLAMIYGVYKKDFRCIRPFIGFKCIECLVWTLITCSAFILLLYYDEKLIMLFLLILIFTFTAIDWYFLICICSIYKNMLDEITDECSSMTPV